MGLSDPPNKSRNPLKQVLDLLGETVDCKTYDQVDTHCNICFGVAICGHSVGQQRNHCVVKSVFCAKELGEQLSLIRCVLIKLCCAYVWSSASGWCIICTRPVPRARGMFGQQVLCSVTIIACIETICQLSCSLATSARPLLPFFPTPTHASQPFICFVVTSESFLTSCYSVLVISAAASVDCV